MSQTSQPREGSPQEPRQDTADAQKQSYHPPQLRELGQLADITAGSGSTPSADTVAPYQS